MEKGKPMDELKIYCCWFVKDDEWGCYVIAPGRGSAKAIFYRHFKNEGEWNDIRCVKVKKDIPDGVAIEPQCLDLPDDPLLEVLGLEYVDLEEEGWLN